MGSQAVKVQRSEQSVDKIFKPDGASTMRSSPQREIPEIEIECSDCRLSAIKKCPHMLRSDHRELVNS